MYRFNITENIPNNNILNVLIILMKHYVLKKKYGDKRKDWTWNCNDEQLIDTTQDKIAVLKFLHVSPKAFDNYTLYIFCLIILMFLSILFPKVLVRTYVFLILIVSLLKST